VTAELNELYQELILDHYRRPRNHHELECPDRVAEGDNPLCGDQIRVYLRVTNGVIEDARFEGNGCAISQASASLMTTAVRGKSAAAALELFRAFHRMVTSPPAEAPDAKALGKLAAFAGVRTFPARVKCANLAWHTLRAALEGDPSGVSTE